MQTRRLRLHPTRRREEIVSLQDIESWFEADGDNPGYHVMTEDAIFDNLTGMLESTDEEKDED